jgi:hypothetical protein
MSGADFLDYYYLSGTIIMIIVTTERCNPHPPYQGHAFPGPPASAAVTPSAAEHTHMI